jgi:hypothetical protein
MVMTFDLQNAIALLERTPKILRAWLEGLPDDWLFVTEGEESWSAFDIVGHFIHGERTDWIPRARIILSADEDKNFVSFDRFAQFEDSQGKTLSDLVDTFESLRQANLMELGSIGLEADDYQKVGIHPELGPVNLGQLLATWVVHDLDHLAQIAQVMGRQYRDDVGPWGAYLGIL